tara:strand:+ start:70 stop:423 length:354 start_codon:yes stop_codon:yes gene_type:complete
MFLTKKIYIFFILILVSSCSRDLDLKNSRQKSNPTINNKEILNSKDKLEITISCDEGNIEEYLQKGWKITKEYSQEKVCSWKSVPANDTCDIDKDKGCKIITPDKVGNEIIYLLEKE